MIAETPSQKRRWPRWWRRVQVGARRANIFALVEAISIVFFVVMTAVAWRTLSVQAEKGELLPSELTATLLIGMLVPVLAGHPREEHLRPFIVTGVLGGFTTFSAFALETAVMLDEGRLSLAGVYIGATLLLGLLAVPLGVRITRKFAG